MATTVRVVIWTAQYRNLGTTYHSNLNTIGLKGKARELQAVWSELSFGPGAEYLYLDKDARRVQEELQCLLIRDYRKIVADV